MKRIAIAASVLAMISSVVVVAPVVAAAAGGLTLVVNSTGDGRDAHVGDGACRTATGSCTLRAALEEADAASSAVTIKFAIPGSSPHTIAPGTRLPRLTNPAGITINGYTEHGAVQNTARYGSNAHIAIQLAGKGAASFDGLEATAGSNTIYGLSIYNFRHAIWFEGANTSRNQVLGDFICTNAAGRFRAGKPNSGAGGILIQDGSGHNYIGVGRSHKPASGPPRLAGRNIISGCAHRGVIISFTGSDYNVVQNNVIGLNPRGTAALPNDSHGVDINFEAQHNKVGGPNPGEGNVISGNVQEGVEVSHGPQNWFNDVIGNFIGTGISGKTAPSYAANGMMGIRFEGPLTCNPCAPNGGFGEVYDNVVVHNRGGGILIDKGQQHNKVHNNWIGELPNGHAAGNQRYGVRIEHGAIHNTIGPGNVIADNPVGVEMDATESQPVSSFVLPVIDNTITRNSIHGNSRLGIDLAPFGKPNVGSTHTDPNVEHGIATPKLSSVSAATVSGSACSGCTVEVYRADTKSVTSNSSLRNYGEGRTYLGSTKANGSGNWSLSLSRKLARGEVVTADATNSTGDTSEFARDRAFGLSAPRATATSTTTSVQVRWSAPARQGGPRVRGYRVKLLRGNTVVAQARLGASRTQHRFADLRQDTRYQVNVAARTAAGYGIATTVHVSTKIDTRLAIGVSTHRLHAGRRLTVSGRLIQRDNGRGLRGMSVTLFRIKPGGGRARVAGGLRTGRGGAWSHRFRPARTGRYQAVFAGRGRYDGDRSRMTSRVRVR
jgi:hypothetical protein